MKDESHSPEPQATALVVDDDKFIRHTVVDLLRSERILCHTAGNGVEALELLRTLHPDLILLDIMMPEMDGIETCRRIKTDPALASIPVIALTARDDADAVLKMSDAGCLMYLTKPFSLERLRAALRFALARPPG